MTQAGAGVNRTTSIPFLDLVTQHRTLEQDLVSAFRRALSSAGLDRGGPEVEAFEREFAAFTGAPGCVGVNSGTDALRFAYQAVGVRPGDEVITVPNTFIATTEALTQAGATIRFVDVDDGTLTMDPRAGAAIGSRTVGLVPVHLHGQPADMDPLLDLARRHGLWVVEDAAQAHGALYKGRGVGTLGALGAFSFYPGKNLGACGEGGAVVGSDPVRLETVRRLREHGQSRKYHHETEGYNGRLHAIQAAFLRVKLPHLAGWNERRRRVASLYRAGLADLAEVRLPVEAPYARHVYHVFAIRAERRDELQAHLTRLRIGTGLHYPLPLHLQPAYRHLGLANAAFPVTEAAAATMLSLPMFPELTSDQVGHVAECIRAFYRG